MPPRKARGVKSSPSTRGQHSPGNVSDTPRPEVSTPSRTNRSQVLKGQASPKSASKGARRRRSAAALGDDSDEISVILSSQGVTGITAGTSKSYQRGSLRRLWENCSGAVLIAIVIVLFIVLLKMGEDEYLDVTSSSTRATANPYHILNVKHDATKKQIRKAYRALTLKWHPDRQEHGCDEDCKLKFNEIHQAYRLLMDEERRSLYDAYQYDSMPDTKKAFLNKIESWEFTGSPEIVKNILKPSLNGGQLSLPPHVTGSWAYLVADTRHEVTDYILETWTEIASKLYGKVAFMRVEGSDAETRKALPLNPVMLPAIVYCDPVNRCQIYNQLMNYGPVTFPKWLLSQYPDTIKEWNGPLESLADVMHKGVTPQGKTPIIVTGALKPPNIIRALALKTGEAFEWIYTSSVEIVEHLKIMPFDMDKGTRGLIIGPNANKAVIQLHGGLWQLDKERWYRERSESEDVRTAAHGHAYISLIDSLNEMSRNNEMELTEETLLYLCLSRNPKQRIICRVRVDPTDPLPPQQIADLQSSLPEGSLVAIPDKENQDDIAGQNDAETDVDLESEEGDEDEEPNKQDAKTQLQILVQPVRMSSTVLGGLRSALVRFAQGNGDTEFLFDFAAGKYQSQDSKVWVDLPIRCIRQEGGPGMAGASCAPRTNLFLKDRLRIFLLRPLGFAKAYLVRQWYHAIWIVPALVVYASTVIWLIYSVCIGAFRSITSQNEWKRLKDDLDHDRNTD